MRSNRYIVGLAALACVVVGSAPSVTAMTTATAAAAPYCGITWGSVQKMSTAGTSAPIVGARTGRQTCYDRLVVDLAGKPAPGYIVRYTNGLHGIGNGEPLAVSGGAVLTVTLIAPTYDSSGRPTVSWRDGTHVVRPDQFTAGGYRTFRDLVYGGNFEGETALGLGVRARLPFRVFTLDGPGGATRLVVDVAHRW